MITINYKSLIRLFLTNVRFNYTVTIKRTLSITPQYLIIFVIRDIRYFETFIPYLIFKIYGFSAECKLIFDQGKFLTHI